MKTEAFPSAAENSAAVPRYWAFICYRREDARLARKVHGSLETYLIPRHLVGKTGHRGVIPKRTFPIFLDSEELPLKGPRSADIKFALEQSRNLIVICSRCAADWSEVDEQIRYFKSLGRGDRVIYLLDGVAAENAGAPEANREFLPAAIGSRGDGMSASEPIFVSNGNRMTVEMVAHLAGVAFDDLQQRELERHHHRLQLILTGVAVLVSVFGMMCMEVYKRGAVALDREKEAMEAAHQAEEAAKKAARSESDLRESLRKLQAAEEMGKTKLKE